MENKRNNTKRQPDKKAMAQREKELAAKAAEREAKREQRRNDPAYREKMAQIVSIVLGVLAILFVVSFIFKGVNESGFFGRIFGDLLYGLFSLPAWLIPALLVSEWTRSI